MKPRREPIVACPACHAVYSADHSVCSLDGQWLEHFAVDPLVGRELDHYRVEDLIGVGGMARVYRARHVHMSRRFALKVLSGDLAADPNMRARFAREAEAASRVDHPNLVGVVDIGETSSGLPYLAMDLVEGESLDVVLAREGAFAPARVIALLRGMLRGLAHAHARGLIHRDLKPGNILLGRRDGEETPRIVDFGIALVREALGERITKGRLVFGTPEYMSPEQARGMGDIDHRADLFSLGVVVYEMLAGVLPFSGRAVDIVRQHLTAEVPPIAERVPGREVPPALEAIVMRLMAKDPADRFASADEVLEVLEAVVAPLAPSARRRSEPGRAGGAPVRRPSGVYAAFALEDDARAAVVVSSAPPPSHRIEAVPRPIDDGARMTAAYGAAGKPLARDGLAAPVADLAGRGLAEPARNGLVWTTVPVAPIARPSQPVVLPAPPIAEGSNGRIQVDPRVRPVARRRSPLAERVAAEAAEFDEKTLNIRPGRRWAGAAFAAVAVAIAAVILFGRADGLEQRGAIAASVGPAVEARAADVTPAATTGEPLAGPALAVVSPAVATTAGPARTPVAEPPAPTTQRAERAERKDRPRRERRAATLERRTSDEEAIIAEWRATAARREADLPALEIAPRAGIERPEARARGMTARPAEPSATPSRRAPTADQLVARYQALGARLDALSRVSPARADTLRDRFFAIPLADAIRRPAQRAEVAAALERLENQL